MQESVLLLHWGSYHWARNLWVLFIYFSSQLCCPLRFQNSPQTRRWECFLVFGNFSFKTPFLGQISIPNSFVSLFIFYILSYLLSKTVGCLSGCLMSSASVQKLFCGIWSAFKCCFNEFVGGESGLPILFLCYLRTTPRFRFRILAHSKYGLISLLSKGSSRVLSNTTVWKHQFFNAQPSSWSNSHIWIWLLEKS